MTIDAHDGHQATPRDRMILDRLRREYPVGLISRDGACEVIGHRGTACEVRVARQPHAAYRTIILLQYHEMDDMRHAWIEARP